MWMTVTVCKRRYHGLRRSDKAGIKRLGRSTFDFTSILWTYRQCGGFEEFTQELLDPAGSYGAKRPEVALEVAGPVLARSILLVGQLADDLCAGCLGTLVMSVGVPGSVPSWRIGTLHCSSSTAFTRSPRGVEW
jgi:hypothetical protein